MAGRGPSGPRGVGPGPQMPDPAEIFKRLDRDDDKQLSLEEFTAGMKRLHAGMTAARQKMAAAVQQHARGWAARAQASRRGPGPGPGPGAWHGRGGPPSRVDIQQQIRQRISSLPPEARKRAVEAMKERAQRQAAAKRSPQRGPDARPEGRSREGRGPQRERERTERPSRDR